MSKSVRDSLKQLAAGYLKNLNAAGMKVTNMLVTYNDMQDETGNDYSRYIILCEQHRQMIETCVVLAEDLVKNI